MYACINNFTKIFTIHKSSGNTMKFNLKTLATIAFLLISTGSYAATPTQNFGECLTDNLNGKERKNLAKWIFFAMAAHPQITEFTKIPSDNIKTSDQYIGKLITRLMTENCPNEMKLAYKANPQAIEKAFELVGQVAMQELMTNLDVTNSITSYSRYADQEKINSILVDK
jgi:hypothetical protein